jgi:hypothetical protein
VGKPESAVVIDGTTDVAGASRSMAAPAKGERGNVRQAQ